MRDLNGKIAWITGAGSGIGQAAAVALAGAGMHCVLSGRRAEALAETAAQVAAAGGACTLEPLDVADAAAVAAAGARIAALDGPLDTLVNSAGLNVLARNWPDVTPEGWRQVIDANLNGSFNCCHAALPLMRAAGSGLVINVSSWAGKFPSPITGPAYNSAKAGVVALSTSINLEEGWNGIRACALCPGEVATPIMDRRPVPPTPEDRARMLQVEEMAETVLYLARLPARACVNELIISPTQNRLTKPQD
ncbi:MAG: SDR family oxidoreductase [Hyphomicrobiales bacterium]|nr:SDR family oxidoreductase [Hyphomicrobiales bacterium]MCP5373730.1 SDR family oxidoreductase [Hyphomicrobiales bacterium]